MDKQILLDSIDKKFNGSIELEDLPEIDLYMDQVIQLFEGKLLESRRGGEDKVLTKTMINNYAKAKLLMSNKNKRYSKEHLILMSLIYELKGSLSINDIKLLLGNIVKQYENNEEYDLRGLYNLYLEENNNNKKVINNIKEKICELNEESYEEKFLLITSLISMSNIYRRMGELLIDNFFVEEKNEKSK